MSGDWIADPDIQAWARHVLDDLVPKLRDSALTISLVPERDTDVKFAVELGMSIMLDKPILLVVRPGAHVPDHLVRVADEIVEADLNDPGSSARIGAAITRLIGGDGAAS